MNVRQSLAFAERHHRGCAALQSNTFGFSKMLDIEKIPSWILDDIRERGWDDESIKKMTPEKAFDEYLRWNAIIGFGSDFYAAVHLLDEASAQSQLEKPALAGADAVQLGQDLPDTKIIREQTDDQG